MYELTVLLPFLRFTTTFHTVRATCNADGIWVAFGRMVLYKAVFTLSFVK